MKISNKNHPTTAEDYKKLVPHFIGFLESQKGVEKVNLKIVGEIVNEGRKERDKYVRGKRTEVFINREPIGNLDFYEDEIWYSGKIPNFKTVELGSTIDFSSSKIPGAYIRMIYSKKYEKREDNWDIPFP